MKNDKTYGFTTTPTCGIWVWVKKKDPIVRLGLKEGGDLLFHKCSTIGANGLNFSVRKGKR